MQILGGGFTVVDDLEVKMFFFTLWELNLDVLFTLLIIVIHGVELSFSKLQSLGCSAYDENVKIGFKCY